MEEFKQQVKHNKQFLETIEREYSTQFFDWKITIIFYIAIHYLKALATMKGIDIGQTHSEIEKNVNPDRHSPNMPIKKNIWRHYKNLYRYSQSSRYEGFLDFEKFQKIKKLDYDECLKELKYFENYIIRQGVRI